MYISCVKEWIRCKFTWRIFKLTALKYQHYCFWIYILLGENSLHKCNIFANVQHNSRKCFFVHCLNIFERKLYWFSSSILADLPCLQTYTGITTLQMLIQLYHKSNWIKKNTLGYTLLSFTFRRISNTVKNIFVRLRCSHHPKYIK